jgi:hypothetical protein
VGDPTGGEARETRPTGLSYPQIGFASTKDIQEVFASSARMIRDQVLREEATFRRDEPGEWAERKKKPGFKKKLMRILDELEGNGEERPGSVAGYKHSLVQREEAPAGARYGEPCGTVSWNPEGRRGAPGGAENNKGQPGSVAEDKHSLSLPEVASDGARFGEPYGAISWNPEGRRKTPGGGEDNKERPGSVALYKHSLSPLEGASEGGDPYGTASWNPDGKRKTRSGEASLIDLQRGDKPVNHTTTRGCRDKTAPPSHGRTKPSSTDKKTGPRPGKAESRCQLQTRPKWGLKVD